MDVYGWAARVLEQALEQGQAEGFEAALAVRALLSGAVALSKAHRSAEDLAQELAFLADNLDDERDYTFMRP
ncbi:hypothetical protein [Pseudomonas mangiferae]|uniref:Uncharacterized protein n=1 Tax=Pseudomonas mangiferae TaxID=2593654 RepID=A0A553H329_9PSED|nr:hypothetical protein [Pseudomonas mangiferae]TRX76158.1 hypothetical protein FM069_02930 [Pseudomonas mangiferae]